MNDKKLNDRKKLVVAAVTGVSMVMMSAAPALAAEVPAQDVAKGATTEVNLGLSQGQIKVAQVEGLFSFDQNTLTPNAQIAQSFRNAAATLCGAVTDFAAVNPLEWKIRVTGDVDRTFIASVDELMAEESVSKVMTCSCGGNPSDGRAIATAEVKGIPIEHLLAKAGAQHGVNTITFVSSDGKELALSVGYVLGHHGVLSYAINDEDLSASVGGNNQLWLSRTAANYFLRDIVEVRVTQEAEAPANPGIDDEHPNSPNVGILDAEI